MMKELYSGHERAVLMLSDVLGRAECELEDLLGEPNLLPVVSELLGRQFTLTDEDRTAATLPDQIKAAARRQGINLPEGWKAEVARRIASSWSVRDPSTAPADALDRAATLFRVIAERFSQFDSQ